MFVGFGIGSLSTYYLLQAILNKDFGDFKIVMAPSSSALRNETMGGTELDYSSDSRDEARIKLPRPGESLDRF